VSIDITQTDYERECGVGHSRVISRRRKCVEQEMHGS
jgi:hypothetical protein